MVCESAPTFAGDSMDRFALLLGDCLEQLKEIPDASMDAVVTDPPYGLEFMGKEWDAFKGGGGVGWRAGQLSDTQGLPDGNVFKEKGFGNLPVFRGMTSDQRNTFQGFCFEWASECLRVLKPGGHLLSFGGTRTYHRMACAIEDAGFEVRDSIHWIYGSGMPKSLDVSKAFDKAAGAKREVVGKYQLPNGGSAASLEGADDGKRSLDITAPATELAKQWEGWQTALKPSHEPIIVARKPLAGTVIANVERHGTGALNIDATRVGDELRINAPAGNKPGGASLDMSVYGMPQDAAPTATIGRWPPNIVFAHLDECDEEACGNDCPVLALDLQNAGASRFFPVFRYEKKASRSERDEGLETFDKVQSQKWREGSGIAKSRLETARPMANIHPTVKPVALMRWLVRLVTPPNGFVLDPFMGSGTTGVAAMQEGFRFVGIEREAAYFGIAEARIGAAAHA